MEFLAWAMFNKEPETLSVGERGAAARVISSLRIRYDIHLQPGYNPDVKCIKFSLEQASQHVVHRPLAFYVAVAVARILCHCLLFQAGFIPYHEGPIAYWYRPASRAPGLPQALPLVFFHGICPGFFAYIAMLRHLCQGRAALLVEMPHIGMSLSLRVPSRKETVSAVKRALARHRVERACVCGHSFGTICAAWMVQETPSLVAQLVLLDPVCFLLALPDVASNFLYRTPRTFMQHLFRIGGSSELGVTNALRRHFWWYNNCLWAEDIENIPTVVHLAGGDEIAPVALVRSYLQQSFENSASQDKPWSNLEVVWSEGYSHGQILASLQTQSEFARRMFLQECRLFAERDGSAKYRRAAGKSSQQQIAPPEPPSLEGLEKDLDVRCC